MSLQKIYDLISSKSKEELSDFSSLKNIVRSLGLWGDPIKDFYDFQDHPYVRSDGYIVQKPEELALFLLHIRDYKINSYCEVGIFRGGLMVLITAFLNKMNKGFKEVCAVDTADDCDIRFLSSVCNLRHACTSEDVRGESFDLCFIDGDHSYGWVKRDWENVGSFSKIVAFHDIAEMPFGLTRPNFNCDVQRFWKEISKEKTSIEISSSPTDFMGIGIIHNHQDA